ncbi:MAG: hypothetical protein ACI9E1_002302 [Cryomorphaceae bacterium]|jgi:hypothetical protein
MTNETKIVSEYRKAQRFFEKFNMPLLDIGDFVLSQFSRPKDGCTLAMDRTNWKFGKTHINILTVGVVIKGIALPIAWKVLPQTTKRGNSNTAQRIAIIENVLKLLPAESIYALTMDREFIGKSWLKWLDDQSVDFIVRIKKSHKINGVSAEIFRQKRSSKTPSRVDLWGLKFYFGAKAINRGRDSHLYVISNKFTAKDALKIYKQRWSIELLFSHLKKRGFNLEDTHMTDAVKLERLFGVVTLSFFTTYSWGLILSSTTNLTVAERRKSIFRLGLESLMGLFDKRPSAPPSEPIALEVGSELEYSRDINLMVKLKLIMG